MDPTADPVLVFAEAARDLASQPSEEAVLDRVVELAVQLLPDCDDAGIMVLTAGGDVESPAVSSQRVRDSDTAQGEVGEGPCFDAAAQRAGHNASFRCADTATDERWPRYLPRARALGVGSILGFQLFHDDQTFGALDIYSERRGAFDEENERLGWVLASHAAVAMTSARSDAQLQTALHNARSIGQAIGMVRVRYRMSEADAVTALRRISQTSNTKMADLAQSIVARGELPD